MGVELSFVGRSVALSEDIRIVVELVHSSEATDYNDQPLLAILRMTDNVRKRQGHGRTVRNRKRLIIDTIRGFASSPSAVSTLCLFRAVGVLCRI